MINGSFIFGFDHDGPDVFDRPVEFAIEGKILTATFHIDPLWVAILRLGLMPFARGIFDRVLRLSTQARARGGAVAPDPATTV